MNLLFFFLTLNKTSHFRAEIKRHLVFQLEDPGVCEHLCVKTDWQFICGKFCTSNLSTVWADPVLFILCLNVLVVSSLQPSGFGDLLTSINLLWCIFFILTFFYVVKSVVESQESHVVLNMVSVLNRQLNCAFLSFFWNCQVQVSLSGLKFSLGDS